MEYKKNIGHNNLLLHALNARSACKGEARSLTHLDLKKGRLWAKDW
jgi:hypothetical protein